MRKHWRRIRDHWNRTDTVVMATNHAALGVFVANCWWHSPIVCQLASAVPLAFQIRRAVRSDRLLRDALVFGAIIGFAWPVGEGLVTAVFGWWGQYLAAGITIWHTPLYCILIGWLASTHLYYLSHRLEAIGYGRISGVAVVGLTAFGMGLLGENLFVWANMWRYDTSGLDWWAIPAFVPVAYGVGYAILPLLNRWRAEATALACGAVLIVTCVGFGLASGFFPR
ncbi:MAG: hypothetical protein KJ060_01895 [Candidatus Hydrogenedentes bacterium]|nr:hypothetical protein [Candidatus Hydrogenedentota bacterium]